MTRLLVADGDAAVARFVARTLRGEGFEVVLAHSTAGAIRALATAPVDLVLVDVGLPGGGGVELCRHLQGDPASATVPVVLLAAASGAGQRVLGLTAGADDWVDKPFDTLELVGRVQSLLRRSAARRAASPLTGLPGNVSIEEEVGARLGAGADVAAWHVDLDHFKGYNDRYGWARGDTVLLHVASLLVRCAEGEDPPVFVGHVGGDDFVLVCAPEQSDRLARSVVERFAGEVEALHDADDVRRGYLQVLDRLGDLCRTPLVSLSIGVATVTAGSGSDARRLLAAASGMKSVAKETAGTTVAVERRREVP